MYVVLLICCWCLLVRRCGLLLFELIVVGCASPSFVVGVCRSLMLVVARCSFVFVGCCYVSSLVLCCFVVCCLLFIGCCPVVLLCVGVFFLVVV